MARRHQNSRRLTIAADREGSAETRVLAAHCGGAHRFHYKGGDPVDGARPDPSFEANGAFRHLQALQDIATANGGNRAAGTPGYDRSADYVAEKLKEADYTVRLEEFDFPVFEERQPPVLATFHADGRHETAAKADFRTLSYRARAM